MSRAALARIAAALLLSVLTLALFAWEGRFQPVARDILPNLDFSQGGAGWGATPGAALSPGPDAAVALTTNPRWPLTYVFRNLLDPGRFDFLRLSAEVRLEGVVPRDLSWQRAGILLRPFDEAGQRVRFWPYVMFEGAGSSDWHRVAAIFPVSDATARLTLYVYNAGESGRFLARGLTLEAVAETGFAHLARYTLIVCWAGLVLITAAAMFARTGAWSRWLLLLLGTLILASTLAPQPGLIYLVGDAANRALGLVDTAVERVASPPATVAETRHRAPPAEPADGVETPPPPPDAGPAAAGDEDGTARPAVSPPPSGVALPEQEGSETAETADPPPSQAATAAPRRVSPTAELRLWLDSVLYEGRPILGLDKQSVGHLVAFALFAGLLALSASGIAVLPLAGYLLLAAASSEVLQSFVISRGVEAADLAMNAIGIVAGMAAGLVVRQWRQRWRGRRHRVER